MPPKKSRGVEKTGGTVETVKQKGIPDDAINIFTGLTMGSESNEHMFKLIKESFRHWPKRGLSTYKEYVAEQKRIGANDKSKLWKEHVSALEAAPEDEKKAVDAISEEISVIMKAAHGRGKVTKKMRDQIDALIRKADKYIRGAAK